MSQSIFYITAGGMEEAERLAAGLVEEKLAACVNIIPRIKSFFYWEGRAQHEEEVLLIGKTRTDLLQKVVDHVRQNHSYDLPCVVSWELDGGNPAFLQWIDAETAENRPE